MFALHCCYWKPTETMYKRIITKIWLPRRFVCQAPPNSEILNDLVGQNVVRELFCLQPAEILLDVFDTHTFDTATRRRSRECRQTTNQHFQRRTNFIVLVTFTKLASTTLCERVDFRSALVYDDTSCYCSSVGMVMVVVSGGTR